MICVSLGDLTPAGVGPALAPLTGDGLVAEIRLDLSPADTREAVLREAARVAAVPLVATCRPHAEGGRYEGSEAARVRLLELAARSGFAYVDAEFAASRLPELPSGVRLILSQHDFDRTPPGLVRMLRRMEARRPHLVKLCAMARSPLDCLRMVEAIRAARLPMAGLAMGELGAPTRILYRALGGAMTYASAAAGAETAPGQVSLADLRGLYRADRLGPRTRVYGLLGYPVAHSRGPALFNRVFAAEGKNAVYVPIAMPDARDLPHWLAADLPAHGYSVTIPHKEAALAAAAERAKAAATIGAANTLVRRGGAWRAENTDWRAAMQTIDRAARHAGFGSEALRGGSALVLGAGGAARALAYGLARAGARVTVAGRTAVRARRLAASLGMEWAEWDRRARVPWNVLANTTPVGMEPRAEESPFPAASLPRQGLVFDAVYTPPETRLLREAAAAGCVPVSGAGMFELQADAQYRLWFRRPMPGLSSR
ncbi:MAG: type I 3-dehydroquinate dehydratase [Planctomycetes bacterium]|nr:type I 3-dehydroquinate dehydratase [Planctomycetota bacterium]